MNDTTVAYQHLLDRLRAREPGAIQELVAKAYDRLTRLAAKMMRESFPKVAAVREVDSVVNETYLRLAKALESVELATPADFFRFAAHKVRQTLLDMASASRRWAGGSEPGVAPLGAAEDSTGGVAGFDPGMSTLDPAQLAVWSELHRQVDTLPEDVKNVFVQHYYLGLTQAEIAAATGEPPKTVSRLWLKATSLLAKYLPRE
jgi:RNA polymerase sigma factor (sigma-70 family)